MHFREHGRRLDARDVGRTAREITIPVVYMTGTYAEEWSSKGVPNSVLLAKQFGSRSV
jgi:hypothetical protein